MAADDGRVRLAALLRLSPPLFFTSRVSFPRFRGFEPLFYFGAPRHQLIDADLIIAHVLASMEGIGK